MQIRFIEYQSFEPSLNMAIDEAISIFVREDKVLPTFRLYGWNENAITIGILADNRFVFPGGQVPGELLLISNIIGHGSNSGLPIITLISRFFSKKSLIPVILAVPPDKIIASI